MTTYLYANLNTFEWERLYRQVTGIEILLFVVLMYRQAV
ncbi:hypothetical protein VIBNIPon4_630037 [Vibrio nigripulchritudo POn4]|nr:hypothetical protein VIBNIAM115_650038 [Vibrio nigripulchritudo AM115]CCN39556.1 hypothetical protein VIBNIFTn2_1050065 [Vibrio nigripulchritudo FTn2]CCN66818.1 hypothetical protein VIBNIPon4_630037 [Vibrio nigripulchritudo POn4]